ncbi:sce7726 family protein [Amycolatopsis sp. w19]|uniref:sce7726 family protein n=1 Tax=Amycolatopsis sp. w19 TaxID=3448134 RepID=UPI003F1DDC06
MNDRDIRAALRVHLESTTESGAIIRDELGLCLGDTRVDIAVIGGTLAGFEIKSDRDTLDRLPGQVDRYSRVLDFATLVCEPRHQAKASVLLPSWWGIWVAEEQDGAVTFQPMRKASRNPGPDPYTVAQLLWRDEAMAALRERDLHRGLSSATRFRLWERMADTMSIKDIQQTVHAAIMARPDWQVCS